MPRGPAASGYARIAQVEEEEEEEGYLDDPDDESLIRSPGRRISIDPQYESIQPGGVPQMRVPSSPGAGHYRKGGRRHRRQRTNSGVDIKAINARLEKWADEIAAKFKIRKIKGKTLDEEKLEIHYSVFQPPEGMRPATAEELAGGLMENKEDMMTRQEFEDVLESVKVAIEMGVQPKMITQGSSGSYFARNSDGKVVGVFKPKDEEPYASKNPKWTKWIHRNLFPCFFGRACLIPNLSYVSEAAAYVLDTRLQTNLVPYTDIVNLSSISFNYDMWDRRAYYRKRKQLPDKVGSFQVFLKGFKDANIFLREHPWPDQPTPNLPNVSSNKRNRRWGDECRSGRTEADDEEISEPSSQRPGSEARRRKEFWTGDLQQSLREELEKLVILDYIMRNTDRGLDNWMIRIDEETKKVSIVAEAPKTEQLVENDGESDPYQQGESMVMHETTQNQSSSQQHVRIGAIDNSLSWPWKHPDAWRSFPFGWLFLPVTLIGRPFSEKTRKHFLPLLTSKQWWSETQVTLRRCFEQDSDFQERMFARQMAVVKGQAFNVVETLKTPDHGPLELTRRARVCVWDDLVDVPIAIPLRTPSAEMSRQKAKHLAARQQPEEMDISSIRTSNNTFDSTLLNLDTTNGIPSPNRFNLSRRGSDEEIRISTETPRPRESTGDLSGRDSLGIQAQDTSQRSHRPGAPRSKTRFSFEGSRHTPNFHNRRKRNLSFSAWREGGHDNDDGDLGYGAARGMEGNHRKVIVERLETVKSKNPVFTWC